MINFLVKSTQSGRETQKPNANRYFFLFSSSTELTFRKGLLLADRMFRPSDRFLANCSVRVRFFLGGDPLNNYRKFPFCEKFGQLNITELEDAFRRKTSC